MGENWQDQIGGDIVWVQFNLWYAMVQLLVPIYWVDSALRWDLLFKYPHPPNINFEEKEERIMMGFWLQAIYLVVNPNGEMKLYEFVVIFGVLLLILAQMPSFHSLRHINMISLILCLLYSTCATVGSVYIGK